jgi:hypothetical protein
MVNVAGASYNDPSQGTRGGSIILPSRFLSILIYFSIIFCGCTQMTQYFTLINGGSIDRKKILKNRESFLSILENLFYVALKYFSTFFNMINPINEL